MPQNNGRDEVIIPAYNCPLVVLAIHYCGLKIKLCDTAKNSFDFDYGALQKKAGRKTLAICPVHLGGQIANVAACLSIAKKSGAFVIEDAAQAFGAPQKMQVGRRGDITFFSLAVGKGLTLYEGGLLTAKTAAMRQALRETSRRFVAKHFLLEMRRMAEFFGYACFYRPSGLHFVYGRPRRRALAKGLWVEAVGDIFSPDIPIHQVSNLRAACGFRAAKRLPHFLRALEKQAEQRLPQLHALSAETGGKIQIVGAAEANKALWPFFMLLMPNEASRDAVLRRLWAGPYGLTRLFVYALSDYDYLKPFIGQQGQMPKARDFAAGMLTISNSLWLEHSRFEKLCHIIKQAYR